MGRRLDLNTSWLWCRVAAELRYDLSVTALCLYMLLWLASSACSVSSYVAKISLHLNLLPENCLRNLIKSLFGTHKCTAIPTRPPVLYGLICEACNLWWLIKLQTINHKIFLNTSLIKKWNWNVWRGNNKVLKKYELFKSAKKTRNWHKNYNSAVFRFIK